MPDDVKAIREEFGKTITLVEDNIDAQNQKRKEFKQFLLGHKIEDASLLQKYAIDFTPQIKEAILELLSKQQVLEAALVRKKFRESSKKSRKSEVKQVNFEKEEIEPYSAMVGDVFLKLLAGGKILEAALIKEQFPGERGAYLETIERCADMNYPVGIKDYKEQIEEGFKNFLSKGQKNDANLVYEQLSKDIGVNLKTQIN